MIGLGVVEVDGSLMSPGGVHVDRRPQDLGWTFLLKSSTECTWVLFLRNGLDRGVPYLSTV